jgi:hypothetical protein
MRAATISGCPADAKLGCWRRRKKMGNTRGIKPSGIKAFIKKCERCEEK